MSFPEWLMKNLHREDPVGDLARDAARDTNWPPRFRSRNGFRTYFVRHRACFDALDALEKAYTEFEISSKEYAVERQPKGRIARVGLY